MGVQGLMMAADTPPNASNPADQAPSTATFHARIGGMVQGVGFRFFVLRAARDLHLTGSVRNRADGDVEVRARGPRTQLLALESMLRQGPPLSRVEHVAIQWGVAVEQTQEFIVDF